MNGAPVSWASRRVISVLPTPVGPIMMMFLGVTSLRKFVGKLLPPPAIAKRDRHGPLGVSLTDDVLIQPGDDFAGSEFGHGDSPCSLRAERVIIRGADGTGICNERPLQSQTTEWIRPESLRR